jgi:hypothetical protein
MPFEYPGSKWRTWLGYGGSAAPPLEADDLKMDNAGLCERERAYHRVGDANLIPTGKYSRKRNATPEGDLGSPSWPT